MQTHEGVSPFAAQVEVVIGNERFGQLFQRNIPATELVGEELRQPLAHVVVLAVGGLGTVYTDVLFEVAVEFVERFQQRFVLLAHAEVSQLHPLGRDVGIAVGDALVVPLDLGADMLQLAVDRLCLVALACGLVGFGIPQGGRQGYAAVDERAFAVHRKAGIDGNASLLHALFVHIEQNLERVSHNGFTDCKVKSL